MNSREPGAEMMKAFKLMDIDDKEYLTKEDLKRVALQLGESVTDEVSPPPSIGAARR
jgi:Ca2+-binding EF-hand superfamily protein